tara:strand:- start:868 stop:1077 length:210 start_codon:yes stop_codon:yes gene_type:complete
MAQFQISPVTGTSSGISFNTTTKIKINSITGLPFTFNFDVGDEIEAGVELKIIESHPIDVQVTVEYTEI